MVAAAIARMASDEVTAGLASPCRACGRADDCDVTSVILPNNCAGKQVGKLRILCHKACRAVAKSHPRGLTPQPRQLYSAPLRRQGLFGSKTRMPLWRNW